MGYKYIYVHGYNISKVIGPPNMGYKYIYVHGYL